MIALFRNTIARRTACASRLVMLSTAAFVAACSASGPNVGQVPGAGVSGAQGDGIRQAPVVAGRPARVFVMAGFDDDCRSLPEPNIEVIAPPAKGEVLFRPGQSTVIRTSADGSCSGANVTGTGIYYTARPGTTGPDSFTVSASAAGKTTERTFTLQIVE